MRLKFIVCCCLLLFSQRLFSQSLQMGCTQIDTFGNVSVSWITNSIPAIYNYNVYASNSQNGVYAFVGNTTNIGDGFNNFTHNGANGETQQWYYYVEATDGNNYYYSDTIGTLFMAMTNFGNGIVNLDWVTPSNPKLASQDSGFTIKKYRQDNEYAQNYIVANSFVDTVYSCGENVGYQVLLKDMRGCENSSVLQTDIVTDYLAPAIPILDTVSINPQTKNIELGWEVPNNQDVFGYIIYIYQGGIWEVVDTVFGAENTHYIDFVNSSSEKQEYRICSIDTCRNASPLGEIHHTIQLETSVNKCDSIVTLSWNAYDNMNGGVEFYRIFVSENSSTFTLLDSVNGNQLNYVHKGANTSSSYIYYVQACNNTNGASSSSLEKDVVFNRVLGVGAIFMRYVSVKDNLGVEVAVFVEDSVDYKQIALFCSKDNKSTFNKIKTLSKVKGQENYIFYDENIDVNQDKNYYYASITDECDESFANTDTINNILLQVLESSADMVNIEWEYYEGFPNRLIAYDVLRQTQSQEYFQSIANVTFLENTYEDNVWGLASEGAKFYYQVVAIEGVGNPNGFTDKSYSNIVQINKSSECYIPNAFVPNSDIEKNRIFKPVLSYVDVEDYYFVIYNRWGEKMFETTDIMEGWDGTVNGKYAEMGVYVYMLTYRIDEKNVSTKRGHVNLLR